MSLLNAIMSTPFISTVWGICLPMPISALPVHMASANRYAADSITERNNTYLLPVLGNYGEDDK